jgi:hypothetical protein
MHIVRPHGLQNAGPEVLNDLLAALNGCHLMTVEAKVSVGYA